MTLRKKTFKKDHRDKLHQGAMQEDLYGAFFVRQQVLGWTLFTKM